MMSTNRTELDQAPSGCMNWPILDLQSKCDRPFNFNWTLPVLKKQLYHSCRKQVASECLSYFYYQLS